MLEKLAVRNFQSHRKTRLRFDPHTTTIVGPTDAGKSALIRALCWVIRNQPNGDAYVNDEANTATVRLAVDGRVVTRRRTRGGANIYMLDEAKFVSFGNNVPEPIANLLNIDEVNIQEQHDDPFWFKLTAGEVARRLNAIVNLDVIDRVMAALAADVRRTGLAVTVATDRYKEARANSKALQYVDDLADDYKILNLAHERHATRAARVAACAALVATVKQVRATGRRAAGAVRAGRAVVALGTTAIAAAAGAGNIAHQIFHIKQLDKTATQKLPSMAAMEAAFAVAQTARGMLTRLGTALRAEAAARAEWLRRTATLDETNKRFIKKRGGVCPLCQRPIVG